MAELRLVGAEGVMADIPNIKLIIEWRCMQCCQAAAPAGRDAAQDCEAGQMQARQGDTCTQYALQLCKLCLTYSVFGVNSPWRVV